MKYLKRHKILFLYFGIFLVIFSSIQGLYYTGSTSEQDMLTAYNIDTSLSEVDTLKLLSSSSISNVVELNGNYIIKTSDGVYYQSPITENTCKGLELAGVLEVEKTPSNFDLLGRILLYIPGLFLLGLLVAFIVGMYKTKRLMDVTERIAMSTTDGGMSEEVLDTHSSGEKAVDTMTIQRVTFDEVQGIDELKPDLYRLVDCLKNPKKYTDMGARMPKGVLLYGPPGTGKTLTAKALAGEAGVPFYSMCGSDFMEKYVGVGAQRVRELYKNARKSAPCIVFIDEIDAIGGGRGETNGSEKDQTINALLAELDGFKSGGINGGSVLTICATNRLDILDPALLRAGRFDLKLAVGLPDKSGREAILRLHSKNKKLSDSVSIVDIAKKTMGFSGAELENLLNESALIAADLSKSVIDSEDVENAFFKIIMDGNKKKRKEKDNDMVLTAWHEAGHALAAKLLTTDGVPTVTIIQSTSGAGGVTFMSPDEQNMPSKKYLRNKIKVDYAGRAAEELYLGNTDDITTGASQDIKQATSVLKAYIGDYGMGESGLLDLHQLTSQYDVVKEAVELSNLLYGEVLAFLKEHISELKLLADNLIERETLYEEDIDELLHISTSSTI